MAVTLTFRYISAGNQQINWTEGDLLSINALALGNIDHSDPQQITGVRQINDPAPCADWYAMFDSLSNTYSIFSNLGVAAVTRDGATCIGNLVAGNVVTLYLKRLAIPQEPEEVVGAGIGAVDEAAEALLGPITNYLVQQAHIRVYIPASNGTGHQTTTCNIMRRMVALGFVGGFEVIYVNDPQEIGKNAGIIKLLLPELALVVQQDGTIAPGQGPNGTYSNPAFGICTFLFSVSGIQLAAQYQFGISGGVDDPNVDPRIATIANVQFFLMLQPFQWKAANFLYCGAPNNRIDLSQQVALGGLGFLGTTCYNVDFAHYATWSNVSGYVAQIGGVNPADTQQAVTDIQAQCCVQNAGFNLLPVYGLTLGANGVLSNWIAVKQTIALANIVIAVLNGQGQAPLNKGTVIMTLDAYEVDWQVQLQRLLPPALFARLRFWQNGTAWNATNITNLQNTQVLIANVPKLLPMPVFNYFYLVCPMPPVYEGKGTTPLLLNSGRPYLQLSKVKTGVESVIDTLPAQQKNTLRFTIVPTPGAIGILQPVTRITTLPPGAEATACINAGNAAVWNTSNPVGISAATFGVNDDAFVTIQTYLQNNFYIDAQNRLLNKFKVLTADDQMENVPGGFPITQLAMYNAIQTACGAGPNNICTQYRNNIALLTTFMSDGTNTAGNALRNYFTGLGAEFNNVVNDKLVKGLAFAIAQINANH